MKDLKTYIHNTILPSYQNADEGHRQDHIRNVIDRSLRFASAYNAKHKEHLNLDMVYAIATFHDIALAEGYDRSVHEIVSGQILAQDPVIRSLFSVQDIKTMQQAVEDHRASDPNLPRSVYGMIVSQADRDTSTENFLMRMYVHRKNEPRFHDDFYALKQDMRQYMTQKYGPNGCALEKIWFHDPELKQFIQDMSLYIRSDLAFTQALHSLIRKADPARYRNYQSRAVAYL